MKRKFTAIPGKGIFAGSATSSRRIAAAEEYDGKMFDEDQMREIRKGLDAGVDVSQYADPKFSSWQMLQIRKGLESGVDVSPYADPKFKWDQMEEIRYGLESGVGISQYADPKFNWKQMEQIRKGLESGVDVNQYADPKFDRAQMEQIRKGLESRVGVSQYAEPGDSTDHESNRWIDEDDFYDMDPEEFAETYLFSAEQKLEDELKIYIEPSIQAGQGVVVIYDESGSDNESIEVDYQTWIEHEQDIASGSDSEEEFKNTMREYIKGLMEDAGWNR